MEREEKLLLARIDDLFHACDKYCVARFSPFLDGAQKRMVEENYLSISGYQTLFFGGYPESERQMFGVFPEWEDATQSHFPISVLQITSGYGEPLSHRDYLGSILSFGIDRNKTGDILIDGNTAYVFASTDICEYLRENIKKVGNRGVKIEAVSPSDITVPEKQFELIDAVAASARLDAVLAAVLKLSRAQAVKLIEAEKVSIDHKMASDGAKNLTEGCLLSVRGYGRMRLDELGANTRKGRLHIRVKRYL